MHACGHDTHMTAWIETARLIAARKGEWAGTLVMIVQPAEDTGQGAKAMLDDGLFTRFPKPDYALAFHYVSGLAAGVIAYAAGPAMANVDSIDMEVRGIGGHGAAPHTTKDPIGSLRVSAGSPRRRRSRPGCPKASPRRSNLARASLRR